MSQRLEDAKSYMDVVRRDRTERVDLFSPDPAPAWQHPRSLTPAERDAVLEVIRSVAQGQASLTVEDIAPRIDVAMPDRRALGALMLAASRRGWITADGWEHGGASRHRRAVRRWVSRLHTEAPA